MRKRLMAFVFITFLLCVPAFAGHVLPGGGYCAPCDVPGCICEPGEEALNRSVGPDESSQNAPIDLGSETLFVLAALLLTLRYRA